MLIHSAVAWSRDDADPELPYVVKVGDREVMRVEIEAAAERVAQVYRRIETENKR